MKLLKQADFFSIIAIKIFCYSETLFYLCPVFRFKKRQTQGIKL